MRQAPLEEREFTPGHIMEWELLPTAMRGAAGPGRARGVTSYTQEKYLAAAQEARTTDDSITSYVAVTFELPGALDREALEAALLHLVRRHEVLRCTFQQLSGDPACDVLGPDEVTLKLVDVGPFDGSAEVHAFLAESFRRIDTLNGPLFVMGAVIGDASTTVYLAFDHLLSDGMSAPLVVRDVGVAYTSYARGDQPELPEAGSYLAFSRAQLARNQEIDADDPRLDYWKAFTARNGGLFPRSPLDLGVEPGRMYPVRNDTETLLDGDAADAMEARCRAVGGNLSLGVLAAVGVALREEGGPEVFRAVIPVSERGRGSYAHSLGWFANPMPIEFSVAREEDFAAVVGNAGTASVEMLRNAGVPFVKAWQLLAPEYAALGSWPFPVNFFSYLDFRRVPGAERHAGWKPMGHAWVPRSNGVGYWFHRNDAGLHMNRICVDTPRAGRAGAAFGRGLAETLRNVVCDGTFR